MRGILGILIFGLWMQPLFAGAEPAKPEEGTLILSYQPKNCFTTPCPQFAIEEINGQIARGGADLQNLDLDNSAITSFRHVLVKGHWTREGDYLKVSVSEWKAVVREKIPERQPKN